MTTKIDQAFKKVKRQDFMLPENKLLAHQDTAFSIGYGQTISQPYTVKKMLEWLNPQTGDNILDIGSGSGWTSVILAHLVGEKGKVTAVERIPELLAFGKSNAKKYTKYGNLEFKLADKKLGYPKNAPYDKILVSAAAEKLPKQLLEQLSIGGTLVIPVNYDILVISKISKTELDIKTHHGFVFVPLL